MTCYRLIVMLLLLAHSIRGQEQSGNGYASDLAFLRESFETSYPSLYRFNTKASIDRSFEKCYRQIDSTTTARDFYKIVKYLLSATKDGHLSCSAPDSLEKYFDEQEKHFPIRLYFTGNKAFADCSSGNMLPPGTEIVRINNEKIGAIRKALFEHIVSDGAIETKKYWILNRNFWFYHSLVYGPQAQYEVTYKDVRGKLLTLSLNGELLQNIRCKSFTEPEDKALLDLRYLDVHTALLTIRTFADEDLADAGLDFAKFLDAAFGEMRRKQTSSLIIDLRGNGGGRDIYGALLFTFLTDKPFYYYEKLETSTTVPDHHPNLALQQPARNPFTGNVYILINGLSFSATSEFCTVAKDHQRAVFIGEETGGTYCGNTSGHFNDVLLPFSKFTVFMPTTRYTMVTRDKKNKDRGIIPDYNIKPAIADLIRKEDIQLNFAIRLAQKHSKR